jgi:3-phenylpropionate/cinnamic acid dioxygenase small subunit
MVEIDLERKVAAYLYREAYFMDEHRYADWLALFDQECVYWIPSNEEQYDPTKHVSILYCTRPALEQHVQRLIDGKVFTQVPKSRLRRAVSNIEVTRQDGQLDVAANVLISEVRNHVYRVHGARVEYRLVEKDDSFKIRSKKVMLTSIDEPQDNVTFLL